MEELPEIIVASQNKNHLKLNISKTNRLVVDYTSSNMDVAPKMLQILKYESFTDTFNHAA